jgi:hypothetical protein
MNEPPQGQRFSHVYIDRGQPTQDSVRLRRRIGAQIYEFKQLRDDLAAEVRRELGIPVPNPPYWSDFLEAVAPRDLLDLITVAYRHLKSAPFTAAAESNRWLQNIQRIFHEENVAYRVDAQGGVHFYVDEEFARNRAGAIAALGPVRYANALHAFEGGMAELRQIPPNGKGAIRGVFGAAEAVFKLILPNMPRLGAAELDGLVPLLQQVYRHDDTARRSAVKMLNSLKDWADAAHFFRHEQGMADEVAQPPLGLAVHIVSTGAAHLRWLAEFDASPRA